MDIRLHHGNDRDCLDPHLVLSNKHLHARTSGSCNIGTESTRSNGARHSRGSILEPRSIPDYIGSEVTSVISRYVRNTAQGISTFRYYDEIGSEITNFANWTSVRFVTVNLAVNVNTAALPNQFTLSSSAAIRNLIGH